MATSSPCFLIQGNDIELHGNAYVITDQTGGSLVGIQVEGNGHYLHDIKLENFAVGVDLYPEGRPAVRSFIHTNLHSSLT